MLSDEANELDNNIAGREKNTKSYEKCQPK
jgi:uncharacterized protein YdcH (DUF465 family)